MLNGVANYFSIVGAVIGLIFGSISEIVNKYFLGIIIGNFIYVGLIDMMPYMKNTNNNALWF